MLYNVKVLCGLEAIRRQVENEAPVQTQELEMGDAKLQEGC